MFTPAVRVRLSLISCFILVLIAPVRGFAGKKSVLHGWLSVAPNHGPPPVPIPIAQKKMRERGQKIVLVDPKHKRLPTIVNQDIARDRVGDYVEISGDLDEQTKTFRVDSVKLLEKGRAMCDVPAKKKS
jgi:hypothetical protein